MNAVTQRDVLDFYREPSPMTAAGAAAPRFADLPNDVESLVRIVQGLGLYDGVARDFYGFEVPAERADEIHIRPIAQMLERIVTDGRPLAVARPFAERWLGRCRHFSLLLVAMLRANGIPARVRCGFGAYFRPNHFEDHWVCETWDAGASRWVLVDPQFDEVWRRELKIEHDALDVPRDRFLTAGDAWVRCRAGKADPAKFGLSFASLHGLWFVAGNLVRDVAALNKVEMLPWDVWGAQPQPDESIDEDRLAFFDRLALHSQEPDASFDELRQLYDADERVRVPATVFNAVTNRMESIRECVPNPKEKKR